MNILIMGAGALGSVFGGYLSKDHKVTLVARAPHVDAVNGSGLKVTGIWGEHIFEDVKGVVSLQDVGDKQDIIFITTKSYDTRAALEAVKLILAHDGRVITMQNGIGNEDVAAEVVGADRAMGGMAIFGAAFVEPGHVEVTVYASECLVGEIGQETGKAEEIAALITKAGIPTLPSDDIIRDKWMKALFNIALNPLSAILKVPYGFLGEHSETRDMMYILLEEAFEVAGAEGIALKHNVDSYFEFFLKNQVPPTAGHRSSMLQDMERGKRTEIDYLNGVIVDLGEEHDIDTPYNRMIVGIIKALEKKKEK